ncbi:hypothetical protein AB3R30_18220 [Leptolyngbyaceae cyanobacterium UHCC 1019]
MLADWSSVAIASYGQGNPRSRLVKRRAECAAKSFGLSQSFSDKGID